MQRKISWSRMAAIALAGGSLVQITGCLSGLAPAMVSLGESVALTTLLQTLLP